ncbi:peptidylprolyl isomerase [Singulisphaera acidiphila]|uniref:peptidylprolyl isomerase n=1 Tax=Singulisphaera acidiphila (strain ATCC BAA-1392 / DSM 18658 / VKM B-2454 / MOB10) TaxID=886293 RepID=L0DMB0_SINAD|nr:peptidylprolyl isomerase [Singulisphaera acidiphila]AGA30524.1 parvulin-like peptidyl-prolyl isomerase [Singulisphaera acidiphila DSM 18658]
MVAWTRGRMSQAMLFTLASVGALANSEATAQGILNRGKTAKKAAAAPSKDQAPPAAFNQDEIPKLEMKRIPVNPDDAIATVNGQKITRQQLADECVARQGEEILETLVARTLIDQALRAKKLEVTAVEIDNEIENVAQNVAHVGREAWLRTLAKERKISPTQYARDIIYPALALRKLADKRVQVTADDMRDSFEAQYGEKIRCRLIMVDKLPAAQGIWEELRKNPAGFEKLAQERSMDAGSRSLGGLLAEPISRHAHPRNVSEAAFRQLVDGDPMDKDVSHKPKDGDFTGPIQVAEATWIILKREGLIEGNKNANPKDERIRKNVYDMIYEVKLKEAMSTTFVELMDAAVIDNKLTGHVKLVNEKLPEDERLPSSELDTNVQLMSDPAGSLPEPNAKATQATAPKLGTPAGVPAAVAEQAESLKRPPVKR